MGFMYYRYIAATGRTALNELMWGMLSRMCITLHRDT